MKFVTAVKHYQKTTDTVIVDTITDNFTIGQYASIVASCGFDLH
jgi:hypothetical protein